jgi:hypothetical protein
MSDFPVDFILPWVDANDTHWQKERASYEKEHNKEDKNTVTRFRDTGTLRYVLRSIHYHCPWYRKIYIITTGHYPSWLDIQHPKIKLITHRELFIDTSVLPVFNSNAIELNLPNIPTLSEHFVHLNDDTIIWRKLSKERFFKNGLPVDFFAHSPFPRNGVLRYIKKQDETWVQAIANNIALINRHFLKHHMQTRHLYHHSYTRLQKFNNFLYEYILKKLLWIAHWHHPQPYLKSSMREAFETYKSEIIRATGYKFRNKKDLTHYFYRYWHLVSGKFEPYFHNDGYVATPNSVDELTDIINFIENNEHINFVCFNDQSVNMHSDEFIRFSSELIAFLEQTFPLKADFEK